MDQFVVQCACTKIRSLVEQKNIEKTEVNQERVILDLNILKNESHKYSTSLVYSIDKTDFESK